jgi:indolepyruvate ferredoxin oxidoreductase
MAAIEVNGAGVELNKAAFEAGRSMAEYSPSKPVAVDASALGLGLPRPAWDVQFAKAREWGGAKAEAGHRAFKQRVEAAAGARAQDLSSSLENLGAARAKLAFYKDEYEVARLHAKSTKSGALAGAGSSAGLTLHLAPPIWPGNPAGKGIKVGMSGAWALPLLGLLAKASWLRGRWFDPFGHTRERASEREDAIRFERDVLSALNATEGAGAAKARSTLASLARNAFSIRGFGAVKDKARAAALNEREEILRKMAGS